MLRLRVDEAPILTRGLGIANEDFERCAAAAGNGKCRVYAITIAPAICVREEEIDSQLWPVDIRWRVFRGGSAGSGGPLDTFFFENARVV